MTWWLSFMDFENPMGEQFLGACIVTVDEHVPELTLAEALKGDPSVKLAAREARRLGLHPGGEALGMKIPNDAFLEWRNQPLDRARCEALNAAMRK